MIVTSCAQFLEHILDAHGGDRIDRDGELVEHQQLGILRQRPRNGQALLLAAGQQAAERDRGGP